MVRPPARSSVMETRIDHRAVTGSSHTRAASSGPNARRRSSLHRSPAREYAFRAINVFTSTGDGSAGYVLQQQLDRFGNPTEKLCVDSRLARVALFDVNASAVPSEALVNVDRRQADAECAGGNTCSFLADVLEAGFRKGTHVMYQGFDRVSGHIITVSTSRVLPSSGVVLRTASRTGITTVPFALLEVNYTAHANEIGRHVRPSR